MSCRDPINTEPIEAAAKALADFYGCAFNPDEADHWRTIASHVLAAADAAGSWNDTERIEAAVVAHRTTAERLRSEHHGARWGLRGQWVADEKAAMVAAFEAAALGWPTWNDTERLRTALTDLTGECDAIDAMLLNGERPSGHELRGFHDALEEARALAESVPSPPKDATEELVNAAKRACAAWWDSFGGSADPDGEWEGLDDSERDYWCFIADRAAFVPSPEARK